MEFSVFCDGDRCLRNHRGHAERVLKWFLRPLTPLRSKAWVDMKSPSTRFHPWFFSVLCDDGVALRNQRGHAERVMNWLLRPITHPSAATLSRQEIAVD